jgi:hypothetical protein
MAMILSDLSGKDVLPTEVADIFLKDGYRTANDGTAWAAFPAIAKKYGIQDLAISKNLDQIKKVLADGGRVLVSGRDVDLSTPATSAGHFYVIRGITTDGEFLVSDANSITKTRKTWTPQTILGSTSFIMGFTK